MLHVWNKFILILLCFLLFVSINPFIAAVIPLLSALTIASMIGYSDKKWLHLSLYCIFGILCIYDSNFLFFLPVISYDFWQEEYRYTVMLYAIPSFIHWKEFSYIAIVNLGFYILISFTLSYLLTKIEHLLAAYRMQEMEAQHSEYLLLQKNEELLDKQDYELKAAALDERNRIAREIHDNVGHLLSSSIIQIGALLAITKDTAAKQGLTQVKETLSTGMDSIRASIHNIHEDSMDIKVRIELLLKDFLFCKTNFQCNLQSQLPIKIAHSFLFIVKEALTNVMKHSDASFVQISLLEYPGMYQLIIRDNGTPNKQSKDGMGLQSIRERAEELGANLSIDNTSGFRIFISLKKENL